MDITFSILDPRKDQIPHPFDRKSGIRDNDRYILKQYGIDTFAKDVFGESDSFNTNANGYMRQFNRLRLYRFIYNTRLAYTHSQFDINDTLVHVLAKVNGVPYASIVLYVQGTVLRMQWIFRLHIPTFFKTLNPDVKLPGVNEILVPKVLEIARDLGVTKILVCPIGKQIDILTRYYGFKEYTGTVPEFGLITENTMYYLDVK